MPAHVHPGAGFEDLDVSDRPDLRDRHVAFRVGEVGEESGDALAPFIPLSLSFGPQKVPAPVQTIKYGLVRDFWGDINKPSKTDVDALMEQLWPVWLRTSVRSKPETARS